MIKNKKDYLYYLKQDKIALNKYKKRPKMIHDVIWKYQILMRKCEYYENCRKDILGKVYGKILKLKFVLMSQKLGFSIGLNVFGPGLSIAHYGCLVVSNLATIGEFCRIHEGVTIGVTGKDYWSNTNQAKAATIGNRVFIGTGAKIIGDITIVDDVAIGANAVVVKDILEPGTTWVGNPARKINSHGSKNYINQ